MAVRYVYRIDPLPNNFDKHHFMHFIKLSYLEVLERLGKPFNPPHINSVEDEDKFDDEWSSVCFKLSSAFTRLSHQYGYEQGDYILSKMRPQSRGLIVSLSSEKIINKNTLNTIQKVVLGEKEEYEIYVEIMHNGRFYGYYVGRDYIMGQGIPAIVDKLELF